MDKRDYKRLLDSVRKTYPELDHSKIKIELKKMEKYSMFAKRISKDNYKILVDPKKCSKYSKDILKGKLAHELAHFKRFDKWGSIRFLIDNILYKFIFYRRWTERKTDKIAIKKGWAKELALDREETFKRISRNNFKLFKEFEKVYMPPKEIKDYAKLIK